jgi:DNA-binding CsgD family transcriptional regulator
LYRTGASEPFSEHDEAVVADAVTAIADLFRLTLLRAALDVPRVVDQPPGVLYLDAHGNVSSATASAGAWLAAIDDRGRLPSAVQALAAAARTGNGLARATLPARDGRWVVLHGSPIEDATGAHAEQVAVIIEGARRVELAEVIASAYGLTPREREITTLVAQGRTTRQMAQTLGISPFTVQDHLKAVFAKTGAQTRGELVATIFVEHYEPQREACRTPGPYGWYLDGELPATG